MVFLANILILIIALEHVWIFVLEFFLWQKPRGLRAFGQSQAQAAATAVLAKNQGVYNLFLAGGLFLGLALGLTFKAYFLGCVAVAGIVGAATVSRRIFYVQALPALVALALVIFG